MFKIISVGDKHCPSFNTYLKRITRWKIKDLTYAKAPRYLDLVDEKKDMIILLDEHGKHYTSTAFADFLNHLEKDIAILVGAADGFPQDVHSKAHHKIALSYMTLPHAFARIILIEQIYRAQQILSGHPYHKD
jgi:rRNA large subunit m3Psi methyltransferase RlmH